MLSLQLQGILLSHMWWTSSSMIRRNCLQLPSLAKTNVNLWLQFLSISVCAWVMFSSVLAKRFQNLARSFLQPKFFLFSFILLRYHCKFSSWLLDSMILLQLIVLETLPSLLLVMKLILRQQFEKRSEIRAACIQVLFSAVYHLRSAVLPYASDLLKISLKSLRKKSEKVNLSFLQ